MDAGIVALQAGTSLFAAVFGFGDAIIAMPLLTLLFGLDVREAAPLVVAVDTSASSDSREDDRELKRVREGPAASVRTTTRSCPNRKRLVKLERPREILGSRTETRTSPRRKRRSPSF